MNGEKKILPEPTLLKNLAALMHSIVLKCISCFETMQYNGNVKSIIVSLVECYRLGYNFMICCMSTFRSTPACIYIKTNRYEHKSTKVQL